MRLSEINFVKIAIYVIIIAAAFLGYRHMVSQKEISEEARSRFVDVYAQNAFWATAYRNHPELYQQRRDSIFEANRMTIDSVGAFQDRMKEHEETWAGIWDRISSRIDSLVNYYSTNPIPLPDSLASDTAVSDTLDIAPSNQAE